MSPEEIAASALAGMESSLPSSSSNGNGVAVVEGDDTNTGIMTTTNATADKSKQESSVSNTKDSLTVHADNVKVDTTVESESIAATAAATSEIVVAEEDSAASSLPKLGDPDAAGSTTGSTNKEGASLSTAAMHTNEAKDTGSRTELPVNQSTTGGNIPYSGSVMDNKSATTTQSVNKTNEGLNTTGAGNKPKRRGPKPKVKLPIEPRLIQCIPKRKEYTNHTYNDFSMIPLDPNYVKPSKIDDMSFVEKIHDILSKPEYNSYISWKPNGRTFGIIIPSMFEKIVCPVYFQHKRYSSFLRQLNNHGFKHLTNEHGPNRNCYYHECFLRNMEYLCQYMPEPKDARRQIPDPSNEPNFDAISLLYPVPPPYIQQQLTPHSTLQQQQQMMVMQHMPQSSMPIMQHMPSAAMRTTIPVPTRQQPMVMNTTVSQPLQQLSATGPTGGISNSMSDSTGQYHQANTGAKKMTMDRNTALAELSKLQEQLTSESVAPSLPDTSMTSITPALMNDKRKIMSDDKNIDDTILPGKKMKLGVAMPQAFPNTTHKNKLSQIESKLKRDAILAAVRKQKEKEEQQEQQKAQQQQPSQSTSFSLYPSTSLQGSQHSQSQPQLLTQQRQPQQQYQGNTVSDYVANPTTMSNTYGNNAHVPKQSLYSSQQQQQQTSQQNPFQREIQFNSQVMGQHQQQRLHSQHLQSEDVTGFPQSQQQQIQELRNQLLHGNNNGQPTPQHPLSYIGTTTNGSGMNRNDMSSINGNDDNTHSRRGTTSQFM